MDSEVPKLYLVGYQWDFTYAAPARPFVFASPFERRAQELEVLLDALICWKEGPAPFRRSRSVQYHRASGLSSEYTCEPTGFGGKRVHVVLAIVSQKY